MAFAYQGYIKFFLLILYSSIFTYKILDEFLFSPDIEILDEGINVLRVFGFVKHAYAWDRLTLIKKEPELNWVLGIRYPKYAILKIKDSSKREKEIIIRDTMINYDEFIDRIEKIIN